MKSKIPRDKIYISKTEHPCGESTQILADYAPNFEIHCDEKKGHKGSHKAQLRDVDDRVITLFWGKSRA